MTTKATGNPWKPHYSWLCEICNKAKFQTKKECDEHEKICKPITTK